MNFPTSPRAASTALLAAALLLSSAGTASAQQVAVGAATNQGARYQLAIHKGKDASGPILSEVTLICQPTGGTHPNASQACSALANAKGDFEKLHADDFVLCDITYDPLTLTAKGRGFGKKTNFKKTFSNRCVANLETDGVFSF
ncbi:serine protease [Streptomyces sp. ISL-98]|uniref:SSI family serine proteinase inhibitor n=1 Tax=Streptomyces sp. ISL-98 TaxID=2819192 RepID=UPI001BE5F6F0|nr:SSI family serine proteinase inhibitor [Streptomyces sp. ISL-98]MBT2509903.1 serine protease [Streptomyces sp. ISL-98]